MLASVIASLVALSQSSGAPVYDAGDLDWLNGCWAGEGLGGRIQECWLTGGDGRMSGVFHFENTQGAQGFSEIIWIGDFETGPAMRLKHFSADLSGWEAVDETVDFPLLRIDETGGYFEGLRYVRDGADAMTVELDQDGGAVLSFSYRRLVRAAAE